MQSSPEDYAVSQKKPAAEQGFRCRLFISIPLSNHLLIANRQLKVIPICFYQTFFLQLG